MLSKTHVPSRIIEEAKTLRRPGMFSVFGVFAMARTLIQPDFILRNEGEGSLHGIFMIWALASKVERPRLRAD